MSDACCGAARQRPTGAEPDTGPARLWQVRELQVAAVAAVLLGAGWLAGRVGAADPVVLGLELVAAVLAASTFVPGRAAQPAARPDRGRHADDDRR